MSRKDSQKDSSVRRRNLLRAAAATGVGGIAGCSGLTGGDGGGPGQQNGTGNGTGNASDGGGGGGDGGPGVFDVVSWLGSGQPKNLHFNPYAASNFWGTLIFEDFGRFDLVKFLNTGKREVVSRGVDGWSVSEPKEGGTVTVTVPPDRKWHDGDDVTANDLYATLALDNGLKAPIAKYVTNLRTAGETEVKFDLATDVNPQVFDLQMAQVGQNTKYSLYEQFVTGLEDATTEEERKSVLEELRNYRPGEAIGTGLYYLAENGGAPWKLEPFPEHPVEDEVEIDHVQLFNHTTNQKKWRYAVSGRVDMMESGTAKEVSQNILDGEEFGKMVRFYFTSALAISFNHRDETFGDPRVRRAIAHVLDRKLANIPVEGPWGRVRPLVKTPTGIYFGPEKWLGDAMDGFQQYAVDEPDTERAAALLKEAGYHREDGTWMDDGGDPIRMPVQTVAGFSEFVKSVQSFVPTLKEFGIQAEMQSVDTTTMFTRLAEGNFRVATGYWGQGYHPLSMFEMPYAANWVNLNHPETVSVPMPVGETEGKERQVDVKGLLDELAATADEDRTREIVATLSWVYNQNVPQIPIWYHYGQMFVDTENWDWEGALDRADGKMANAHVELFRRGIPKPAPGDGPGT
jgi:peptide/nickel transport system substrate-binding protein